MSHLSKQARLSFHHIKRLPIIMQNELAECAHVCVAMISYFWGYKLDLHALRKIHPPSTRGMTLREMVDLLSKLGLKARALRVPLEGIKWIKCPAILHWNLNHFVVLKRVKRHSIIIHDPALGVRRCSIEAFSQSYTGIVLEVEKARDFKLGNDQQTLRVFDFFKSIVGGRKWLVLIFLLSLVIEMLSLLNPLLMQYVTDNVMGSNQINHLYGLGAGFSIIACVHVFTEYMRSHLVRYLTTHLTEFFSSNVMQHLLKLPVAFFEARHKGDIQSKFHAIDEIQKKISTDFINTILDGFMFILNLIFMFIYSRILTLIVLLALGLYSGIRYLSFQSLKKQTTLSIQQHAQVASTFLETLHAITPIKLFLKEQVRFNTWRNAYIEALNADIQLSKIQTINRVMNQLLFNLEHITVICVGASLVLANQFTVGMLIAFLAYRLLLVNKSSSFIQNLFDYKLISVQLNRLGDIIFQQPEVLFAGAGQIEQMNGALTLRHITFQYQAHDGLILNDINLDIQAGEKIVITGASGCGKSTLLKVMIGLLAPTSGEICIDGIPLRDFGLKQYREQTACVMQEDMLLSGSILENITFFDEDCSLSTVYSVAQLACIHDTICQFPMGYETRVGDMGSTLSGGQKQRILLARALYKKPKILFLDEATSHLDVINEKNINQSLKALDITQVVIAHREETIRMADRVIHLS